MPTQEVLATWVEYNFRGGELFTSAFAVRWGWPDSGNRPLDTFQQAENF